MGIEIAIFSAVIIGVVAGLLLENYRRRIEPELAGPVPRRAAPLRLTGPGSARPGGIVDSAADLRLVSDAGFAPRPLLSGREADVLGFVEAAVAETRQGWRVVPQVRLVDIVASADAEANAVIGEHRLDMLIVSGAHLPVAALDYQPLGQLKEDSALRDAIKREALRRADIPFIEIRANEPLEGLKAQIQRLAAVPQAPKASRARAPATKPVVAKAVTVKAVATKPAPANAAAPARPAPKAAAKPAAKTAPVAAAVGVPEPAKPAAKPVAKAAAKPDTKAAPKAATKPAPAKAKAKPAPKDPPAEP